MINQYICSSHIFLNLMLRPMAMKAMEMRILPTTNWFTVAEEPNDPVNWLDDMAWLTGPWSVLWPSPASLTVTCWIRSGTSCLRHLLPHFKSSQTDYSVVVGPFAKLPSVCLVFLASSLSSETYLVSFFYMDVLWNTVRNLWWKAVNNI